MLDIYSQHDLQQLPLNMTILCIMPTLTCLQSVSPKYLLHSAPLIDLLDVAYTQVREYCMLFSLSGLNNLI